MPERSCTITLRRPDDVHLCDGPMLGAVLPYTACQLARAIVMPNLPAAAQNRRGAADLGSATKHGLCAGYKLVSLID